MINGINRINGINEGSCVSSAAPPPLMPRPARVRVPFSVFRFPFLPDLDRPGPARTEFNQVINQSTN